LWSQRLRFLATGDEQALEYAAKAFSSIDHIFRLTEAEGHRGYLCKPYDGKVSKETSPDQYFAVANGLWHYRSIAPRETRERIDFLLPAMVNWWRDRNYRIVFFDMEFPATDANEWHNPSMTAMNLMAYLITGDADYQKEALRLVGLGGTMPTYYDNERERLRRTGTVYQDYYLPGYLYDDSRRDYVIVDWESRGAAWMAVCSYPFLLQHDLARTPIFKHALYRVWKHMQYGMRDDKLSLYSIQYDVERDIWLPINVPPTPESEAKPAYNWHFMSYHSEVCWGDAAGRLPHVSLMAHQYAYEFCAGALHLAKDLLRRLDNQRLLWMIDPDGKQIHERDEWMRYTLSSEVPAFALLAYWTARLAGIELE
jgi:hypothetical protein